MTLTPEGIRFSAYSTERHRDRGNGTVRYFMKREGRTDEELLSIRDKVQEEQRLKNVKDKTMNVRAGSEDPSKNPKPLTHQTDIQLKLDPDTGNTVALLAASKSGKSTLAMHLYRRHWAGKKWISSLFSISGQAPVYRGHPDLIRVCGFPEDGERLIKLEKLINTKGRKPNKYRFLNILDDIISAKHSKLLNTLLMVYRNSQMSTMLSLQYPFLMSKQTRANVNFVLLGRFHSEESCGDVVRMFLRAYLSARGIIGIDAQINWYKAVTKNHGFVLIDNLNGKVSLHRLASAPEGRDP